MSQPKFYLTIKQGYWMAGKHGYSIKRNAVAFMEKWIKTMIDSGLPEEKVYDAIRVDKA